VSELLRVSGTDRTGILILPAGGRVGPNILLSGRLSTSMDRQQSLALVLVLLMVFSSIAYAFALL